MPELETSPPIPSLGSRPLRQRASIGASLFILAVYILLRLPGIAIPIDRDEGAFGAIGQLINRGGLPYRDAMDHKPPVAFYINALALHIVPATPQGIHVFLLFYNLLTLVCVFLLAKICFRKLSAALCCAFAYAVFSASPAIHGFTASTEIYALLPTTLSLLLAVAATRNPSRSLMFLSGIAGAAACWTKQTAFTTVLFVFLFVCITSIRAGHKKTPAIWLAGAVGFSAALAAYFYTQGIFNDFIYWCFTYEMAYASVPLADTLGALWSRFAEIARGDFILPAAGIAVAAWSLIRKQPHGYFLASYLLLSFLGTVPGYSYPHYFVQVAPAVALTGGYAIYSLLERNRTAAILCGLLILAISIGANRQYFLATSPDATSRFYFGGNPFAESRPLGDYIASVTNPNDLVLMIGSEPQILFYARRQSASPFIMIYPLTSVHARYREFENTMWTDVKNNPPKYIVASMDIPTSIAWDGEADLEIIRNLCGLLAQDYRIERKVPILDRDPSPDETNTCLSTDKPYLYLYKRNPH